MNTGGGIRQPTIQQRRSEHTAAEITLVVNEMYWGFEMYHLVPWYV